MADQGDHFDLDDIDNLVMLEDRLYQEGRSRGESDGAQSGHSEGFHFGVAKGRFIGEEIGHMKGFVLTLKRAHDEQHYVFNDRIVKMFDSILSMIDQLPVHTISSSSSSGTSSRSNSGIHDHNDGDDGEGDGDDDLVYEGEDGDRGEFMNAIDSLKNKFKLLEVRLSTELKKKKKDPQQSTVGSSSKLIDTMSF